MSIKLMQIPKTLSHNLFIFIISNKGIDTKKIFEQ
jgi:hypothetical protein